MKTWGWGKNEAVREGLQAYQKDVLHLVGHVKSSPLADGFTEIFVPGEIEEREAEKRTRDSIPVEDTTWQELIKLAKELNIKPLTEYRP